MLQRQFTVWGRKRRSMRLCRPIPQEDRLPEQGKIFLLNHPVQIIPQEQAPQCRGAAGPSQAAGREHRQAAKVAAGQPQAAREAEIHQEMVRESQEEAVTAPSQEAGREHQQAAKTAQALQEAAREHQRVPEKAAEQLPVEAPEHRQRPEAAGQLQEEARELLPHQGRCPNENSRTGPGRL